MMIYNGLGRRRRSDGDMDYEKAETYLANHSCGPHRYTMKPSMMVLDASKLLISNLDKGKEVDKHNIVKLKLTGQRNPHC